MKGLSPQVLLCSVISLWPFTVARESYAPPEVTCASDAYFPYNVVVDGLFVLDVSLSSEGQIQRIEALRDPGSMVGAAKTSVNAWKFQPAAVDGKPRASRLTVVFLYRPADYGHAAVLPPKDFIPVIPRDQTVGDEYVPVGLLSFDYPNYPVNSVAWGSVVVQVTVDSAGEVKDVNSLHGMTVFDNFALDALKKWHFRPGTFRGKPVTSKVVVAFVFQTPLSVP